MPDIWHVWGGDLATSPTGDLAPVDGLDRGRQRILRRLLTNQGDYLWHPEYGAGLGARIGQLRDIPAITAVINSQIMQEACVGKNPPPVITVSQIENGAYISIVYQDVETGSQSVLQFNITE
jgi:phage baseplate assembly protein W